MRNWPLTDHSPQMSRESFAYRSYTRSFKAKFLVFSPRIRGFQVKGTNKALCQEGLILDPLNFCVFCLNENVMMSKLCTQMRLEGRSFHDGPWDALAWKSERPLRFLCVIYAQLCVNGNSGSFYSIQGAACRTGAIFFFAFKRAEASASHAGFFFSRGNPVACRAAKHKYNPCSAG